MKSAVLTLALAALLVPIAAQAEEPPPARKGFQLALRTGVAIPVGSLSPTTKMSDALGVQVPFLVDIGGKPIPELFIGGYLGVAVGNAAGSVQMSCQSVGISCTGVGFRGGLMAQWNFKPGARVNPWLGYGFGYEIAGSNGSTGGNSISNSVRGFEYAHLLFGVDFRLQDYFGIGPFLDGALGQYDYAKSTADAGGSVTTRGGALADKAFHGWIIVGIRAVAFP